MPVSTRHSQQQNLKVAEGVDFWQFCTSVSQLVRAYRLGEFNFEMGFETSESRCCRQDAIALLYFSIADVSETLLTGTLCHCSQKVFGDQAQGVKENTPLF